MNDLIPGGVKHTELECEIRWRGHLHPSFNHGIWPPDETTRLHGLVAEAKDKGARPDWVHIAKDLGVCKTFCAVLVRMSVLIAIEDWQDSP